MLQKSLKIKVLLGLAIIVGLFIWHTVTTLPKPEPKKTKVRILLDWTPNTNHLGAYVAVAKGFFADQNLEVSIDRASGQSVEVLVANEQAEFGYSSQGSLTFARAAQSPLPITSVAAVIQHNTSGFAAPLSKGIKDVRDFEGKKYGAFLSPTEAPTLEHIMKRFGADSSKVQFIPANEVDFFQGTQTNLFDFSWIFQGWTGVQASLQGQKLYYQSLAELDIIFDYYTPAIISSEKYLKENRDTAMRFMHAITLGYEWTIQNPDEAAKILYEAEPSLDKDLVLESARFLSVQFTADAPSWGVMRPEVFDRYTQWLKDNSFVPQDFSNDGIFTNDFVAQ